MYKDILLVERLLYHQRYLFSLLESYARYDWRVMAPNMHCNLFLIRHFVHTYTHNSKTTISYVDLVHIEWLLYDQRGIFSVLELDARYHWQVMAANTHCSLLLISNLCILTRIIWKLQVIHGCSAYRTTALLLEIFLV